MCRATGENLGEMNFKHDAYDRLKNIYIYIKYIQNIYKIRLLIN